MKTNLFLGLALLSMAPNAVSAQENGSYNIVVFLTICISYANNCFTL